MKDYIVRLATVTFLISFLILCGFQTTGVRAVDMNTLVLGGNAIHYLSNGTFAFKGNIVIEGNATLFVEDAEIQFVQSFSNQYGIILRNPEGGFPRLITDNATLRSTRAFNLTLTGNSAADLIGLRFAGNSSSFIELRDSSLVSVIDNCSLKHVYLRNSSMLQAVGSDIFHAECYDASSIFAQTCRLTAIATYNYSTAQLAVSSVADSIDASDFSTVSANYSTVSRFINTRQFSNVRLFQCFLSQMNVKTLGHSSVSLENSTSQITKFSSSYVVEDYSKFQFLDCAISDSYLNLTGNSEVNIERSTLTLASMYSAVNTSVSITESSIDWICRFTGNSFLSTSNSSFGLLSVEEYSKVVIEKSNMSQLRAYSGELVDLAATDSIIDEVYVELDSQNATIENLGPGMCLDFALRLSNFQAHIRNTEVRIGWSLRLVGSCNVTIADSVVLSLLAFDTSKIRLINSSYNSLSLQNEASVDAWSMLSVAVVDYLGAAVENVNVLVLGPNGYAESKQTDNAGKAVFVNLLDKSVDVSGEHPAGNYTVTVEFEGRESSLSAELGNDNTLQFTVSSPWWYWYVIVGSIVGVALIIILAATLVTKRRKASK